MNRATSFGAALTLQCLAGSALAQQQTQPLPVTQQQPAAPINQQRPIPIRAPEYCPYLNAILTVAINKGDTATAVKIRAQLEEHCLVSPTS